MQCITQPRNVLLMLSTYPRPGAVACKYDGDLRPCARMLGTDKFAQGVRSRGSEASASRRLLADAILFAWPAHLPRRSEVFPWLAGHALLYLAALGVSRVRAKVRVAVTQARLTGGLQSLPDAALRVVQESAEGAHSSCSESTYCSVSRCNSLAV